MPAGSVRLPELKQDIKVDTKDLVRAEAAAKRFKQTMNRNLQIDDSDFDRSLAGLEKKLDDFAKKNREIKVDLDLDTAKAREKLKQIRNEEVKVKVDADTAKAVEKIKRLGRETVRVAVDATTTRAAAAIRRLSREKVQIAVDGETTRAKAKIDALGRINVRPSVDPKVTEGAAKIRTLSSIQLRPKVDPSLVGAAAKIRTLSQIEIKPKVSPDMRNFRKSVLDFAKNINVRLKVDVTAVKAEIKALDRTKITVIVDADTEAAERKIAALAREARLASTQVSGLSGHMSGLSRTSRLAASAIGTLSIAGTVGGAIGILGAGAIGAASALHGAAPAALALTGALGGLGVAAGGLAAIFKSNEGLKGSSKILRDAFQGIQDDLQRRVNPSILEFMRSVAGLAPIAREMVPPFAQAFTEITQMFSNLLKDSNFQNDLRLIVTEGIKQFRQFGEGARNALQGIISLAAATGPHITKLAEGFKETTAEFRNWVNEARRTGELNRMLETSFAILRSLGRTVRDLAVGFKQMFQAADFSGFTASVLATLEGIAGDFRRFTRDRQADMQAMFANLKGQFEGFRGLIASLADGIRVILTRIDLTPLMRGIQAIVPELANALVEFTNALARVAEQAAPPINALLSLIRAVLPDIERVVTLAIQNVTQVVEAVRPGILRFTEMLRNIGEKVIPVIAGAARNLGSMFSAAMTVIAPIAELLGNIIGLLGDMRGPIGVALSAFLGFKILQGIFANAAQGVRNLATGTTAAGQKVGVVGRAVRGLAQPFAAATIGAGRLVKGLADVSRGATTMEKSQSGILRGLSQVSQGFSTGGQRATEFSTRATAVGTAVTTASASLTGTMGSALTSFGRNIDAAGGKVTNLAGNVTTASQRMTSGLGGAVSQAGSILTSFGQTVGTVGTRISAGLGNAAQAGATKLGTLGNAANGLANGAIKGLGTGLNGLIGALGGPWGAALTAAGTALAIFGQKSAEAQQKQNSLTESLKQTKGAFGDTQKDMLATEVATEGYGEALKAAGISTSDFVDAVTKGGPQYDAMVAKLREVGGSTNVLDEALRRNKDTFTGTATSAQSLADKAEELRTRVEGSSSAWRTYSDAQKPVNDAMKQGEERAKQLTDGFKQLRDSTGSADERLNTLKNTLDGFNTTNRSAQDAQKTLNDAIRESGSSFQDLQGKVEIVNGSLQTNTEVGSKVYDQTTQIADAALKSALAVSDDAKAHGDLAGAATKSAAEIQKARDEVIAIATRFGASREEAERYADSLGLIPSSVNTLLTSNAPEVQKQIKLVTDQLGAVPPNTPINISVPLAPEVIQKLRDIGVKVTEIPGANGQPARIELTVPDDRVKAEIPKIISQIENPTGGKGPGGAPAMPATVDTKPMDPGIKEGQDKITAPPGGPPGMPAVVDLRPFAPGVQQAQGMVTAPTGGPPGMPLVVDLNPFMPGVQTAQDAIRLPQGGPPAMPAVVDLDPFKPGIQTAQDMVTNPQGGGPAMPINANVQPGEQQALAWVARINAYPAAMLPISANVAPGEQIALAWVDRINAYPGAALPLSANITELNNQYNQAFTFITNNRVAVPLVANITELNAQYAEAYNFIMNNRVYMPIYGDFSQFYTVYDQVVQQVSTTPVYIPIYGQFMGIQGLPGMGGGMAEGGIIANEKGRLIEYFDNGGMSPRDHASLKAASGKENKYPGGAALDGMATAKGMGLTPMSANRAAIVAPNTWRVIGDRAQDDESYIPINNSARSTQILEETAKRMGYALERYAQGGFSSGSPTAAATNDSSARAGARDAVASSTVNNNEAPLIGGDLVVSVPAGTSPQEAMNEVVFQMRRAKRGGVHRRGTSGVHR